MPTVSDEDVLELVDRFDIPLEDTIEVERLQAALAEKLEAASGAPALTRDFLGQFERGLALKYEILRPQGIETISIYRDIKGRFASPEVAQRKDYGVPVPHTAQGSYSVQLGFYQKATGKMMKRETVFGLLR